MDPRSYKAIVTKSGHTYHTFVAPPKDASTPTLLFVHGFPSTAYDWRHQVAFFTKAGYGAIAPDLLGHGGSSKPAALEPYAPSKVTADLIDILDSVKVKRVVAVGHDWGSILVSRLGMYYPTRFAGMVFLASGYCPPLAGFDLKAVLAHQREHVKSELFGYWLFLAEDRAKGIVDAHIESLLSIWYTSDPGLWKTVLAPSGKLEPWLQKDTKAPLAPFVTQEDRTRMLAEWRKAGGLGAALKWYKLMASDLMGRDDRAVAGRLTLELPVYFAGCARDAVCIAQPSADIVRQFCPRGTAETFDTGHWVHLEVPEKLNRALLGWIEKTVGK